MKKKYQEYEYSNTRFIEFMKNEEEKPPLPEYDENGIRICSAIPELKIGDIVIRENKLSTIELLQHLCRGIADIISFFLLYSLDFITRYFYTNCIKDS